TDLETCSNYYQLGQKEHKWVFPFNLIKRKYYSGPINVALRDDQSSTIAVSAPNWRKKLIINYFYPMLSFFGVYDYFSSISLSPELCRWLDDYKPDIIYGQASSLAAVLFCRKI